MSKKEKTTSLTEKDKKAFTARAKKAMKGKDIRTVVHAINNDFPELRTLEVNERVEQILAGKLFDEQILSAIENIEE